MYSKIVNPMTGRKVSIYGKLGKKVLANYIGAHQHGRGVRSLFKSARGKVTKAKGKVGEWWGRKSPPALPRFSHVFKNDKNKRGECKQTFTTWDEAVVPCTPTWDDTTQLYQKGNHAEETPCWFSLPIKGNRNYIEKGYRYGLPEEDSYDLLKAMSIPEINDERNATTQDMENKDFCEDESQCIGGVWSWSGPRSHHKGPTAKKEVIENP